MVDSTPRTLPARVGAIGALLSVASAGPLKKPEPVALGVIPAATSCASDIDPAPGGSISDALQAFVRESSAVGVAERLTGPAVVEPTVYSEPSRKRAAATPAARPSP